jgi:hypothetical protein
MTVGDEGIGQSESFIPPVIDCLPALAAGDASIEQQCADRRRPERREKAALLVSGVAKILPPQPQTDHLRQ